MLLRGNMAQIAKPLSFIDLFAGIGGFHLAFDAAGASCVFASEWDKFAAKTYTANFGQKPHGDITAIAARDIPHHDILTAGFPCQPFSLAGVSKRNSLGMAHGFDHPTQGTLFFDIVRILSYHRPAAFVLENVKNVLSHNKGATFRIICQTLEQELGYTLHYKVIDAKGVVPQHRERVYMVGFREPTTFHFPAMPRSNPCIADILEEQVPDRYTLSDGLWQYLQQYAAKHKAAGNGFGFGLVNLQGTSRTLPARYYKDGSDILIPQMGRNPRRLTPRECTRLMGYPDSFEIVCSDTQTYRQCGNSVVFPVVATIAAAVVKSLRPYAARIVSEERTIAHEAV